MSTFPFQDELDAQLEWQREVYREAHRHPEVSGHEHATAERLQKELESWGLSVQRIGGTGVVTVLRNGEGPTVLARADIDALPVAEATGLDYASEEDGVMHACGHDMHLTALLGAAKLMHARRDAWSGTYIALFQPAEEDASGARQMIDDGLVDAVPQPDVALGQHILPLPAGHVYTAAGAVLSQADSVRVTLFGRGAHGSMPHLSVDPVVLAASVVMRLQTVVSRETQPGEFAVLTVGSITSGSSANVIPDRAQLLLNLRTYDTDVRRRVIAGLERIVRGECEAAGSPKEPEFEYYDQFPLTQNAEETTEKITEVFREHLGPDVVQEARPATASEDFSELPDAFGVPYVYWFVGCVDPDTYEQAVQAGRVNEDIPANHSPLFAPVIDPTVELTTKAQVIAALAYLG